MARIRDNQRRSRARRKEYLQELETKYRTCEAVGVEASTEIQTAARRVLEENRRLRLLLKQQGLSDSDIDGFSSSAASSPSIKPENPQFPLASTTLDQLLTTRRQCRPGSVCDSEETPRRQSCVPSIASQPPPQPYQNSPTTNALPRQLEQQQHQHQPQPQHISIRPAPPQLSSPQARPLSSMSSTADHENYQQHQPDYPVYDPQSHADYMYPMPIENMGNLAQWNLPPASHQQPPIATSLPQQQQSFMPATSMPGTDIYAGGDMDSSSCYVAADAIRSFNVNAGPEVERALGCRDSSECQVSNNVVFELMDHYSASGHERMA